MKPASLGIVSHLGWATAAVVALEKSALHVLRCDRLETADPNDRQAKEPFHVAGGFKGLDRVPQPTDPEAALLAGLNEQRRWTAKALGDLARQLATSQDRELVCAGILVSRGRSAPSFGKATGSHTQIHIEEGIAARESAKLALVNRGVCVHELDQRSLLELACKELGQNEKALFAALAKRKPENDGPWRKEEKLAAIAAWVAWTRPRAR